jgi:hypothetical protein
MIQTNNEPMVKTPHSVPSQIVDKANVPKASGENSDKKTKKAVNIEKDGHKLESARKGEEWPQTARKK